MARGADIAALVAIACGSCGGGGAPGPATPTGPSAATARRGAGTERLLAMLPQGAQVVVELDLARLRANPVIGAVVTRALAGGDAAPAGRDAAPGGSPLGPAPAAIWLRRVLHGGTPRAGSTATPAGTPGSTPAETAGSRSPCGDGARCDDPAAESPLAVADQVVLAAYGVGTAQAATLTVLAAPRDLPGATRLADGVYAIGPPEWVEQAQQRVALAGTGEAQFAIQVAPELLALRAHAMPADAPGASLRVTARLSFDARIALTRETGLELAPAQLSAWGDVADDFALVIDCDASDPGGATARGGRSEASRRLAGALRGVLAAVAEQPTIRLLGLPSSIAGTRVVARGTWVRAILAIGPDHLRRVVERAAGLLGVSASHAAAAPSGTAGTPGASGAPGAANAPRTSGAPRSSGARTPGTPGDPP